MNILFILVDIFKLQIASARWGNLSEEDEQLIINSPFSKVISASVIRRGPFTNCETTSVE